MIERYIEKKLPDPSDAHRRMAMGKQASILGIILNLAFALFKIAVGFATHAISMIADGFNNLMDLLSSAISLAGFHFGSMPADRNHPYGHARLEYLASFVVSLIILWTGGSLLWQSLKNIVDPSPIGAMGGSVVVLLLSIVGKFFLYRYNVILGRRMQSDLLIATGYDARGDVFATSAVVLSLAVYGLSGRNIDGWMGALVSAIILKSGWDSMKETVDSLLGQKTDPELIRKIMDEIERHPIALGVHDLMYHDYGASRKFLTLHVEVDSRLDILEVHEEIDEIERELEEIFRLETTIHIDPIRIDDPRSNALYDYLKGHLREIHPKLDLHDFRIVTRKDGLNLVFDVLVPMGLKDEVASIDERLKERVKMSHPEYQLVVTYDPDYQDLLEVGDA